MDGEATHLLLGPHGDFTGLIKKQNLFMFQLSTFCKPGFPVKTNEKPLTDETQQERKSLQ